MENQELRQSYWKRNLVYVSLLLGVWFIVSFVFGILLVESLNQIQIAGFQLGFWFAQQGAIYVFVLLIVVYVRLMNRLDKRFGFAEVDDGDEVVR